MKPSDTHSPKSTMQWLTHTFIRGLAAVLPISLCLYLIVWTVRSAELIFSEVVLFLLPEQYYAPGVGIVCMVIAIFCIGLVGKNVIVRAVLRFVELAICRIPLVKSVYSSIRDFMTFIEPKEHKSDTVVAVSMPDGSRLIGLITSETLAQEFFEDGAHLVGVYLPMSFQMGGYTLYVERNKVEPLDIEVEEAMRLVMTGGIKSTPHE